jgi:hypothetical protein
MSELPPWREVTPDDFLQATYWQTSATPAMQTSVPR